MKGYSKRVALYFLARQIVIFSQVFVVGHKCQRVRIKFY